MKNKLTATATTLCLTKAFNNVSNYINKLKRYFITGIEPNVAIPSWQNK